MELVKGSSKGSKKKEKKGNDNFYHLMLESIEDYAVFTTDTNGTINSWNNGAEGVLGYTEKEILETNGSVLFTPADVEKGEHLKEMQTARKTGRAVNERFHVRKD